MTDNKLIAEFMGVKHKSVLGHGKVYNDYSKSWDWLMPVVQKCFDTQQPEEGQHYFINESLLTMDIEVVYDRVVEFIKEHNEVNRLVDLSKYICGSCGDRVNTVAFNEDKDVDECVNCM